MKPPHNICLTCCILFPLLVQSQALQWGVTINANDVLEEEQIYLRCSNNASSGEQGWVTTNRRKTAVLLLRHKDSEEQAYISKGITPPGEQVRFLYTWISSLTKYSKFYFRIANEKDIYLGSHHNDELSATTDISRKGWMMRIVKVETVMPENPEWSEEQLYGCSFEYTSTGRISVDPYVITQSLIVRGRPSPPYITVETNLNRLAVKGRSYIMAKCKVNVGRSGLGTIHWRLIRGNNVEVISQGHIRVDNLTRKSKNCTLYVEQTLTVEIKTSRVSMRFDCFVDSSDFPVDNVMQYCSSHSSKLCGLPKENSTHESHNLMSIPTAPEGVDVATVVLIAGLFLVAGFVVDFILDWP